MLWDLERAAKVATVQRNEANIWAVAFTGDATRFATASHDWKVTLWDANQPSAPLHVFDGHRTRCNRSPIRRSAIPAGLRQRRQDRAPVGPADADASSARYNGPRDFVTALAFSH